MRWITARRRHPAAGYAVVLLTLIAIGMAYAAVTGGGSSASASAPSANDQQIAKGREIFASNCSSCHGLEAQGTALAPSLIGVCTAEPSVRSLRGGALPAAGGWEHEWS